MRLWYARCMSTSHVCASFGISHRKIYTNIFMSVLWHVIHQAIEKCALSSFIQTFSLSSIWNEMNVRDTILISMIDWQSLIKFEWGVDASVHHTIWLRIVWRWNDGISVYQFNIEKRNCKLYCSVLNAAMTRQFPKWMGTFCYRRNKKIDLLNAQQIVSSNQV